MAPTIVVTGYPGFLGSALLPRLLAREPDADAVCIVQDRFADLARGRAEEQMAADPALAGRIRCIVGDITDPALGLDADVYRELASTTTSIHHLAAVYDLTVPLDLATAVNVDGTRHVVSFSQACDSLERLHYVSTCYVSGRHTGIWREDDLVRPGQVFNNHYESTKHHAEVVVREAMAAGLPATIYRPAVVAGDSRTGDTQKLDGIYFVIRWLLRQPSWLAVVPTIGDPTTVRFNLVPRDHVVDAIVELSGRNDTVGRCFALADPEPFTISEMMDRLGDATGRRLVRLRLPKRVAKGALAHVPGVEAVMGIPADAADYFTHPTFYDNANADAALAGTGIMAWDRDEWLRALVAFTADHMAMPSDPMI